MPGPTEYSITELAIALGLTRRQVERRVDAGTIPSIRISNAPNSKRVIITETLRTQCPAYYEALVMRGDDTDEEDDGNDF